MTVELRPATAEDRPALAALARGDAVAPFVAVDAGEKIELGDGELYVVEHAGARAGGVRLVAANVRSRIFTVETLMLDPAVRGRGLGTAAVLAVAGRFFGDGRAHRLQAEILAFNQAGLRTFERAGFVREGLRRQAYDRHGAWQDAHIVGLLDHELISSPRSPP